jgi:hypothetical protein
MMNWKRFGRKGLWPNFEELSRYSPGGTEEKYEKPQSQLPIFGLTFQRGPPEYVAGVLTNRPQRREINLAIVF